MYAYVYIHIYIDIYTYTYILAYTHIRTYLHDFGSRLLGRQKANGQRWFLIRKHTQDLFLVCPPRSYNSILVKFLKSQPVITLRACRMSFAMNCENWIVVWRTYLVYTTQYYNTLRHTVTHCNAHTPGTHTPRLPLHTATHCNALQHTATHCNTLQRTATPYSGGRIHAESPHCCTLLARSLAKCTFPIQRLS